MPLTAPMTCPNDYSDTEPEFLKAHIDALTAAVTHIDSDLKDIGCSDFIQINVREEKVDKVVYASELKRLHNNLISANKALTDRVLECQNSGMTPDDVNDMFWPNVTLPGSHKPSNAVLKDYGRAVDTAFGIFMNFLVMKTPVDSKEFLRKRNRLLNDKIAALMEIRKCQLQLLPDDDNSTFSLSQWTLFALKEFSEGDPATGTSPSGIPLLRHNSDSIHDE
jgi:hypothetical protein